MFNTTYLTLLVSLLDTTHFVGYTFSAWFYSVTNYLNPLVLMNAVHWYVLVSLTASDD